MNRMNHYGSAIVTEQEKSHQLFDHKAIIIKLEELNRGIVIESEELNRAIVIE